MFESFEFFLTLSILAILARFDVFKITIKVPKSFVRLNNFFFAFKVILFSFGHFCFLGHSCVVLRLFWRF